jgi:hypothetical protein
MSNGCRHARLGLKLLAQISSIYLKNIGLHQIRSVRKVRKTRVFSARFCKTRGRPALSYTYESIKLENHETHMSTKIGAHVSFVSFERSNADDNSPQRFLRSLQLTVPAVSGALSTPLN